MWNIEHIGTHIPNSEGMEYPVKYYLIKGNSPPLTSPYFSVFIEGWKNFPKKLFKN